MKIRVEQAYTCEICENNVERFIAISCPSGSYLICHKCFYLNHLDIAETVATELFRTHFYPTEFH